MPRGPLTREFVREAYAVHSGELYSLAARSLGDAGLAEEAIEETFMRAWRTGARFDPGSGSLRAWLFAILREVLIDLGRDRAAGRRAAEEGVEQSLLSWRVEEAMRRIDGSHRRILVETHYRGRPYAEVAIELGVPEGTVKSRVYDALRALDAALEEVTSES